MLDLLYDIVKREIVLAPNGDLVTTTNPSVQNGGALLYSSGANIDVPDAGIDIERLLNGGAGNPSPSFELNRWRTQAINDGATLAEWKSNPLNAGPFKFEIQISYL